MSVQVTLTNSKLQTLISLFGMNMGGTVSTLAKFLAMFEISIDAAAELMDMPLLNMVAYSYSPTAKDGVDVELKAKVDQIFICVNTKDFKSAWKIAKEVGFTEVGLVKLIKEKNPLGTLLATDFKSVPGFEKVDFASL